MVWSHFIPDSTTTMLCDQHAGSFLTTSSLSRMQQTVKFEVDQKTATDASLQENQNNTQELRYCITSFKISHFYS